MKKTAYNKVKVQLAFALSWLILANYIVPINGGVELIRYAESPA